jgi:predicted DNA-binding transcriptional regulator YafY
VEPVSLVNLGRRWYLVAWDCDRRDWRTFRMDRIPKVPVAGGRFEPRELPDGLDPATYVAQNLSGVQYRHQARVTLFAPAAEVEAGHRWARGQVEAIDERSCSYSPSDDSLEWLALRIAFLGVDFVVHDPPELAEQCAALSRRFGSAAAAAQPSETSRTL